MSTALSYANATYLSMLSDSATDLLISDNCKYREMESIRIDIDRQWISMWLVERESGTY